MAKMSCGEGGITKQLASRVPHKRVVAVDVDAAYLEYAQRHNNAPTIQYVRQDMSIAWPNLSPEMRALEGSAGMIFANFSFQHIRAKQQLMSICRRLLASGDVNRILGLNEGRRQWCPSTDQQLAEWRQLLDNSDFIPSVANTYKTLFETDDQYESENNGLLDILFDVTFNAMADAPDPKAWTHFLADESVTTGIASIHILRL
ncbi:unnamed protein product, partial [Medioppia subpectinata]